MSGAVCKVLYRRPATREQYGPCMPNRKSTLSSNFQWLALVLQCPKRKGWLHSMNRLNDPCYHENTWCKQHHLLLRRVVHHIEVLKIRSTSASMPLVRNVSLQLSGKDSRHPFPTLKIQRNQKIKYRLCLYMIETKAEDFNKNRMQ